MIHEETHPVTKEHGPRPYGGPDRCFYCGVALGSTHKKDCVMRDRTVVVKMEVEIVVRVPESWDVGLIEFQRNEGSWCSNNVIQELKRKDCLCNNTLFTYVREATEEDEEGWDLKWPNTDTKETT